jgi:hypothetical protein
MIRILGLSERRKKETEAFTHHWNIEMGLPRYSVAFLLPSDFIDLPKTTSTVLVASPIREVVMNKRHHRLQIVRLQNYD